MGLVKFLLLTIFVGTPWVFGVMMLTVKFWADGPVCLPFGVQ